MFSGTVIDELMVAVARAEETAEAEVQLAEEAYCPLPQYCGEAALAGVA